LLDLDGGGGDEEKRGVQCLQRVQKNYGHKPVVQREQKKKGGRRLTKEKGGQIKNGEENASVRASES